MPSGKLCVVCAWRETCQKKYTISKRSGATCPDFTRDLSIPEDDEASGSSNSGPEEGALKTGKRDG